MFFTGRFWRKRESTHDMSDLTFSPIRRQLMLCLPEVRKQFKYNGQFSKNLSTFSTLSVETSTFARKTSAFLMSVPTCRASTPFCSSLCILALTAGWLIFKRLESSACDSCGFSDSMLSIFRSVMSSSSGVCIRPLFVMLLHIVAFWILTCFGVSLMNYNSNAYHCRHSIIT